MHFALLVSKLPHINEARTHYDAMLMLEPRTNTPARMAECWRGIYPRRQSFSLFSGAPYGGTRPTTRPPTPELIGEVFHLK